MAQTRTPVVISGYQHSDPTSEGRATDRCPSRQITGVTACVVDE